MVSVEVAEERGKLEEFCASWSIGEDDTNTGQVTLRMYVCTSRCGRAD